MHHSAQLIPLIPLLPLLGALVNGLLGRRLPRLGVAIVACGAVLGSLVLSLLVITEVGHVGSSLHATVYPWLAVGDLSVDVGFRIDQLSAVMCLVVCGVGLVIHVYSVGYMAAEPAYGRYFAYLNLFTFAMLVLVLADSLPLLFVGWEGVGLCSYLLIGFWYADVDKAAAGKKAFVVNRVGDVGFLVAMMLLFRATGTLSFEGLSQAAGAGMLDTALVTGVCLMLLLGATGKSAQIPLYVWLPDAMAGPTPVSALIHAATMVTAGIYLTARLGFLLAMAPIAMVAMAAVGAVTALFAASIATAQHDIKKVLAYSTVSQLGFMFAAAGVGAYGAAVFHLVTHAFFKACLFLGAGSVIHGMSGEQDIRQMGGLRRKMPLTFWTFLLATLAITGFPLLSGFMSKDAVLWSVYNAATGPYAQAFGSFAYVVWALLLCAAGLTSFYMWRLLLRVFLSGELRAAPEVARHVHESPWTMTLPLLLLAGLSVAGGVLGVPHVFGGGEWILGWLAPIVGQAPIVAVDATALELLLMGVSVAAALVGFAMAWGLYGRRLHPLVHRLASERPWRWVYARVAGAWHVDALYDLTIVRPLNWTSRVVLYEGIDRRVVDGAVGLLAWFARSVGFVFQLFQSGNIQRYLAIFVIGTAVLLYGWYSPYIPMGVVEAVPAEQVAEDAR